jgi:AcrR family transcriptional regulator
MSAHAAERRIAILDCAITLFLERGFAAVSTRHLAERANLARSHVYHYFSDWPMLRREAFERFAQQELEQVQLALQPLSGRDALEAFVTMWLLDSPEPSAALWVDAWVEGLREPELAQVFDAAMHAWLALLSNTLGRTGLTDDRSLARSIFALLNGYTLTTGRSHGRKASPSVQEVLRAIDLLIAGSSQPTRNAKISRKPPLGRGPKRA